MLSVYNLIPQDFSDIHHMFIHEIVSSEEYAIKIYQKSGYNQEAKTQVKIWQQLLRIAENRDIGE